MKKIFLLIISLIILLPPQVFAQNIDKETIYKSGLTCAREFNKDKCKQLYEDYYLLEPENKVIKWLQAVVLMQEHNLKQSKATLKQIIGDYPDFYPAQVLMMQVLYLEKDYNGSYLIAKELMKKKEVLSEYNYVLTLLFAGASKGTIASKDWKNSIPAYFEVNSYFSEAEKLMPNSPEVLYGIGTYYLLRPKIAGGCLNKAIEYLNKAKNLTPDNPDIYVRLAQVYDKKNIKHLAEKNINTAKNLDKNNELLNEYFFENKNK